MAALVEEKRGPRNPHRDRVSSEVEQKILDYALGFPTHGAQRVSNELRLAGTEVGPSRTVQYIGSSPSAQSIVSVSTHTNALCEGLRTASPRWGTS